LSVRSYYITIDYNDQAKLLKQSDSPPIRRFATTWLKGNLGLFRIYASVIGPQSEQSNGNLSLSESQTEDVLKAINNIVELLEEKLR
jgi:hypothetical protein